MKWLLILMLALPVRGGVEFDGTDDYLTAGSASSVAFIQNTLEFTISAWIKLDSSTARQIICGNTVTSTEKGFFLIFENHASVGTNTLRFAAFSGSIVIRGRAQNNILTGGSWRHVALVSTGAGNNLTFYVDGVAQTTTYENSYSSLSTGNSTRSLGIGASNEAVAPVQFFDGRISDLQIYDEALSATQISAIASSRLKGPKFSGLVAYWPLDDVADGASANGATFVDRAGSANATGDDGATNGTLLGRAEDYLSYP